MLEYEVIIERLSGGLFKRTAKHRLVHASSPVELSDGLQLGVRRAPVYSLHRARVPAVDVSCCDEHFGVGVCLDQLFCESDRGPVAHGLAVAEKLVPLLAAKGSPSVVFGGQRVGPHQAIGRVLD